MIDFEIEFKADISLKEIVIGKEKEICNIKM